MIIAEVSQDGEENQLGLLTRFRANGIKIQAWRVLGVRMLILAGLVLEAA